MKVLLVTPASYVLINRRCFKSEKADLFFSKVVNDGSVIEVYDIADRRQKALNIAELNARKHRMIINNKKFFICSISENG